MVGQKYEEGLRVAEMRYRSFYEKSSDALMTLDPSSGLFTFANPSAIAMFGARDEADFVSRALWQYSSVRQPNGDLMKSWSGRKTWSVIETALPRLFELRSFSLVGIALVPPKR